MCFILYMIQLSVGVGSYTAVISAKGELLKTLFLCRQITHICLVAGISLVKVSVAFFLFLITFTLVCWGTLVSVIAKFLISRICPAA
jgi:hypothetical protein